MFSDLEYRHTATISRDAWFLKLWSWAWMTEPENADFCKLFWGFVFMPLNLFVRIVGFPFWLIFQILKALAPVIGSHLPARKPERKLTHAEMMAMVKAKQEADEARLQKRRRRKKEREAAISVFLGKIGAAADRVVGVVRAGWSILKWVVYLIGAAMTVALAGGLVWGVVELAPLIGDHWVTILTAIGLSIGFCLLLLFLLTVGAGTAFFFAETRKGLATRRMMKSGSSTFFHIMYMGLVAVKTRTCPKIVVKDEKTSNPFRSVP